MLTIIFVFAFLIAGLIAVIALDRKFSKSASIIASAGALAVVLFMVFGQFAGINLQNSGTLYQFATDFGIALSFNIGTIQMILLAASSVILLGSVLAIHYSKNRKSAYALALLFGISSAGIFTTSNLIFFFVFWDIGLIALFFTIGFLGYANRKVASQKFLIYSFASSTLLLLGILLIYFYSPVHSFDMQYIMQNGSAIPNAVQVLIFAVLAVAFLIKMPVFPFHLWMNRAYTEAPTQGSMLLSGVLSKYGAYGLLLLFLMLPIAQKFAPYIAALAVLSSLYAAFLAIRQTDMKQMLAYVSMAEVGILVLGIASGTLIGTNGAAYGMLTQGLSMALLFLAVGYIEYMFGTRDIRMLRGIVNSSNATTYSFFIGFLAVVGLPLTAGFIAELMIFMGAYSAFGLYAIAMFAVLILIAANFYFVISKSMLSTEESANPAKLLTAKHWIAYALLMFFIFFFGIFPFIFFNAVV